jgi:hypothetical protein
MYTTNVNVALAQELAARIVRKVSQECKLSGRHTPESVAAIDRRMCRMLAYISSQSSPIFWETKFLACDRATAWENLTHAAGVQASSGVGHV